MLRLLLTTLICLLVTAATTVAAEEKPADPREGIPFGVMNKELMETIYAGNEKFRYDVSYTGGLKLGELHLRVDQAEDPKQGFIIHARVTTDNGMFSKIYPIEDIYATRVGGPQRLPYHYEVWQKEGYSYEAHRVFKFRQKKGVILYQHNDKPVEVFKVKMPIQNEFSSFFSSRLMDFFPGRPFLVPTFADEKRNEVVVMVRGREKVKKTILGDVDTMVVEPIMEFSGLYDKRGDTVIWYSDDECRVPVRVNSKLVLGSLTAKLVSYSNPACPKYDGAILEKYRIEAEKYVDER
ncbi:MAG: DUF3108 domain-containing protein [Desulfofustis sp.]|nr:DUF3108 domain-containing protein [Desulfofustis sp.]